MIENFRKLGIIDPILKVIEELNFEQPTEIQEKMIPLAIQGNDVIAESATGTGKTLAFGVKIIEHCVKGNGIQALALVPTRELADQVCKSLNQFSKYKSLRIVPIYGGVSINPQINELEYADVVVGTPGRILDHLQRRTINLSRVNILVLDEADRMLDMGFIDDVRRIVSQCPRQRQTMLLSATVPEEINRLIHSYMNNPIKVNAINYVDPTKMKQVYYDTADNLKFSLLAHLLKNEKSGLVLVFCNTQRTTEFVAKNLKRLGFDALAIHGGHSQNKRTRTMDDFHAQQAQILVCTDLVARGIDIKDVSHVYNYESPPDERQYVHRIGRTARAGEDGIVINLISQRDHENFGRILRYNVVEVTKMETPTVERVSVVFSDRNQPFDRNRFRRGNRSGYGGHGHGSSGGQNRGRTHNTGSWGRR